MGRLAFVCIPLTGLLLISCGDKTPQNTQETGRIPVVSIAEKDITLNEAYVSDIQAIQNVEIRSRISGFLERIHVDEGQRVTKGQVLFTIGNEEYLASVEKARATVNSLDADAKTSELEADKVKLLVDKKILSHKEFEVAEAKLKAARAKVDEAKAALRHTHAHLSYTTIRAPFDGVLDRIPLKVGSLLEEGTLITSVSDISSMFAYFNISENEYLDYLRTKSTNTGEQNDAVRLVLSDGKEYPHPGKVEIVVSEFEESTGSIAFRARFPNPQFLLKHGATGKVELSREVDNALLLPQKAVFEVQDKNYVFVLDRSNKVRMTNFVPMGRLDRFYIVKSGLKEGDKIVFEGIQNIKDGMVISPQMVSMDSLTKRIIL